METTGTSESDASKRMLACIPLHPSNRSSPCPHFPWWLAPVLRPTFALAKSNSGRTHTHGALEREKYRPVREKASESQHLTGGIFSFFTHPLSAACCSKTNSAAVRLPPQRAAVRPASCSARMAGLLYPQSPGRKDAPRSRTPTSASVSPQCLRRDTPGCGAILFPQAPTCILRYLNPMGVVGWGICGATFVSISRKRDAARSLAVQAAQE